MALISPINNLATPMSYSNPITPVTPVIRKPSNLDVEKTDNAANPREIKVDDLVNKSTAEKSASVEESAFVEVSPEEQQQFAAAQQKAQRAEFISQANSRPSADNENPGLYAEGIVQPDVLQKENPAITLFNQLQNIDAAPRLGQEVNRFA